MLIKKKNQTNRLSIILIDYLNALKAIPWSSQINMFCNSNLVVNMFQNKLNALWWMKFVLCI